MKKDARLEEKRREMENASKELKLIEQTQMKEQARKDQYMNKFKIFDNQYKQKHDWYQKNIIAPQIEKHLQEFDNEKIYNKQYTERQIQKEQREAEMKKFKE